MALLGKDSCFEETVLAEVSGFGFGSARVRILETKGVPVESPTFGGGFSDTVVSSEGEMVWGVIVLELVVLFDSGENRFAGLLEADDLLVLSLLKSRRVAPAFGVDLAEFVVLGRDSSTESPDLREVEFTPNAG